MSEHANQLAFERMVTALHMIEEIAACACIGPDAHERGEHCFQCDIYTIAHGAAGCCDGCPVAKEGLREILAEHHSKQARKGRHESAEKDIAVS